MPEPTNVSEVTPKSPPAPYDTQSFYDNLSEEEKAKKPYSVWINELIKR